MWSLRTRLVLQRVLDTLDWFDAHRPIAARHASTQMKIFAGKEMGERWGSTTNALKHKPRPDRYPASYMNKGVSVNKQQKKRQEKKNIWGILQKRVFFVSQAFKRRFYCIVSLVAL